MSKYHVNGAGEPGPCNANNGQCPFSMEDDPNNNHYDSKEEAREAYEKRMNKSTGGSFKTVKQETKPSKNTKSQKVGLRELNKLAKESSNNEALKDAAERGSERVLSSLVNNEHATSDSLVIAAERTKDDTTKVTAMKHNNYPVEKLSLEDFKKYSNKNVRIRYRSDAITDSHVDLAVNEMSKDEIKRWRVWDRYSSGIYEAVSNPYNKVSKEKVEEVVKLHPEYTLQAEEGGKYKFADHTEKYSMSDLSNANISKSFRSSTLDALTDTIIERMNKLDHKKSIDPASIEYRQFHPARIMLQEISTNPNTSAKTLDKLSKLPKEYELADYVYDHPNTSDDTRKQVLEENPGTKAKQRFEQIIEKNGGLRKTEKEITTNTERTTLGNSYYEYTYQLDIEKVKSLELTEYDVKKIFKDRHNAGLKYDKESGKVVGRVDSSG